jgi:hypothetical protein
LAVVFFARTGQGGGRRVGRAASATQELHLLICAFVPSCLCAFSRNRVRARPDEGPERSTGFKAEAARPAHPALSLGSKCLTVFPRGRHEGRGGGQGRAPCRRSGCRGAARRSRAAAKPIEIYDLKEPVARTDPIIPPEILHRKSY